MLRSNSWMNYENDPIVNGVISSLINDELIQKKGSDDYKPTEKAHILVENDDECLPGMLIVHHLIARRLGECKEISLGEAREYLQQIDKN